MIHTLKHLLSIASKHFIPGQLLTALHDRFLMQLSGIIMTICSVPKFSDFRCVYWCYKPFLSCKYHWCVTFTNFLSGFSSLSRNENGLFFDPATIFITMVDQISRNSPRWFYEISKTVKNFRNAWGFLIPLKKSYIDKRYRGPNRWSENATNTFALNMMNDGFRALVVYGR